MAFFDFLMGTVGYSLVRFSTKKQATGDSYRRQVAAAEAFARRTGITLDTSLHESDIRKLGMSALSGEHVVKGPLRKFIAGIEKRTVRPGSLLLVGEWNRLTRQISSDALKMSIWLMEHGIGIVDLQDEAYYTLDRYNADIGLQLSLQLKISMAHQYSANLRHNLNAKWVARREAMLVDPTAHASNACPEWLEAVDGVHRKIEARIAVIERIKGYRYLGLGKHAIATRLNTIDPVPAFRSTNGWHPSSVEKLVKNRALMGFYTPHYADGSAAGPERKRYPEVVKPNDWWRMQWPQDDAKPKGGRRPAEMRNLLHRICICRCGGRMIYVDKGGRRRELLVCTNAKRGKCDNRYWWKYAPLEAELLTALSLVDFTKFLDRHDPQIERIAALEAEIANIAATVEELLDEFRAKKPASVAKRIAVWEAEKDALVVERDQLRREARIAEANANRDAYDEFKALVASLPSIVEGEREGVRTRINTELRGMIDTAIADGSHLVVRLAAAPWHRLEILFDESRLTEFRQLSGERPAGRACDDLPARGDHPLRRAARHRRDVRRPDRARRGCRGRVMNGDRECAGISPSSTPRPTRCCSAAIQSTGSRSKPLRRSSRLVPNREDFIRPQMGAAIVDWRLPDGDGFEIADGGRSRGQDPRDERYLLNGFMRKGR